MRSSLLLALLVTAACGEDADPTPDSPQGNRPPPRVIPGGGIGDGAIDGVVNLYVIDENTREPISGAEVAVGELTGTTDATGLFVAEGVVGPQDVLVRAAGHRKELWLGANGANVTVNLQLDNEATPPSVTLTGSIPNFANVPVAHTRVALVNYSQTTELGDPANEIETPAAGNGLPPNLCFGDTCTFSVRTRTGRIALYATILDFNDNGTPADPSDDSSTVVGFAVRQGIDTATATGAQDLTVIPDANLTTVGVNFGTPPAGLTTRGAFVALELEDGVITVATTSDAAPSLKVPTLASIGATGYRLTALVSDGANAPAQSIVLRRGLTGTTLSAGDWLSPPAGVSLTRQGGSWTRVPGATAHGIELSQGATRLLGVSVFDDRSTVDLPSTITLPSGSIDVSVTALGATGLDVTDFSLDDVRDKLDRFSSQETTLP